MICAACLGAKKINGENCPACNGEGKVENIEFPSMAEVLEGEDIITIEERVWWKSNDNSIQIDITNTEIFNPLDSLDGNKARITVFDMLGPFGSIKPFEEVSQNLDITYDEWKSAADKIEAIQQVLGLKSATQ